MQKVGSEVTKVYKVHQVLKVLVSVEIKNGSA